MRSVDLDKIDELPGERLDDNSTFRFRCHPGISCFNRCCRNLNLFLYPYDVVRLKNNLKISSEQFLEKYVDVVLRPDAYFPDVLLHMDENNEMTCPFLSDEGCLVYPDRPDACRTFPVEQGMFFDKKKKESRLIHFFRPPEFCRGQDESQIWTPKTWEQDQKAEIYHSMTAEWAKIKGMFQNDPWGLEGPEGRKAKMAFMATYNVDGFREFVFKSSFLKRYKLKTAFAKKIKKDDVELLTFGFEWVNFFLWAIPSKHIRLR